MRPPNTGVRLISQIAAFRSLLANNVLLTIALVSLCVFFVTSCTSEVVVALSLIVAFCSPRCGVLFFLVFVSSNYLKWNVTLVLKLQITCFKINILLVA